MQIDEKKVKAKMEESQLFMQQYVALHDMYYAEISILQRILNGEFNAEQEQEETTNKTTTLVETPVYNGDMSWMCKNCGQLRIFNTHPKQDDYNYCCECGAKIIEYRDYE